MTAESVAYEHVVWLRRQGSSLAEAIQQARLALAAAGLDAPDCVGGWDHVVSIFARAWMVAGRAAI